jgi:hypothetical protein
VPRRLILLLLGTSALLLAAAGGPPGVGASQASSSAGGQTQNPLNDQGSSPDYRSLITSISPAAPGLGLQVLQFSDRLQLRNGTGRTVTVYGYEGEPYARVLPDGTVEVNTRSPAYYLNQSFYGNVTVPPSASASFPPRWTVVDRTGQLEWHDHRIHWMSPVLPPQVKDKGRRTLIFDWQVPISVGASKGHIAGQLFWVPESSSAPTAAIIAGAAIVVLGLLFIVLTRRRRVRGAAAGAGAGRGETRPDAGEKARHEAW